MKSETFGRLCNLLEPYLQTEAERRTFYNAAFALSHDAPSINFVGSAQEFCGTQLLKMYYHSQQSLEQFVKVIAQNQGENRRKEILAALDAFLKVADTPRSVHILTSTKGGVGKTLLCLSLLAYYREFQSGVKATFIDINTMNPDLSTILQKTSGVRFTPNSGWRQLNIEGRYTVLRPDEPYLIKGGASYFWLRVKQAIESSFLDHTSFIVDTSLNIANLVSHRTDIPALDNLPEDLAKRPQDLINEILSYNTTIYIWIIWTWLAFHDHAATGQAIANLQNFGGNRVVPVHVLNLSAIIPPEESPFSVKQLMRKRKRVAREIRQYSRRAHIPNYARMKEYCEGILREIDELLESSDYRELAVPGLDDLSRREVGEIADFQKFQREFIEPLRRSSNPYEALENLRNVRTRPKNVFPISVHVGRLRGYTEMIATKQVALEDLQKDLEPITLDIAKNMEGLEK